MKLGNKLTTLRKQNKLTQEKVADELSVTRQTISNWELDQTKPDIDQIKGLSRLYNISVDELIDNDIKELLTEKISNVEKLTGLVYKILKGLLISIVVFSIVFIIWKIFWGSSYAWFIGMGLEHECTLNNETYYIEIKRESIETKIKYNETLITEGDVNDVTISPFISIPDLEKYKKAYQVKNIIYNYFETNGGSCNEYVNYED